MTRLHWTLSVLLLLKTHSCQIIDNNTEPHSTEESLFTTINEITQEIRNGKTILDTNENKLNDSESKQKAVPQRNITYTLTFPINETIEENLVSHERKTQPQESKIDVKLLHDSTQNPDEVWYEIATERTTEHIEPGSECSRPCTINNPMICRFHFKVEWYTSMSKACYQCPYNETNCDLPDCIATNGVKRPVIVVNRQLPGPAVEVCQNDIVVIDVENMLPEETTSIHWHGHHQRSTPFMDGVPFVTQCPIPPRTTFRYTFKADTPGTHFWHSHSALQRGDGMFGAFIIKKPRSEDPHNDIFDEDLSEHTVVINDWTQSTGVNKFVDHHHSNGDNKPDDILVNGKGRYQEFVDATGIIWTTPTEIFRAKKGLRYRFRIINAGFLNCPIQMSIDNHTLVVISTDGTDIAPEEVDSLVTYAGERFDVIVEMNQDIGNYWVKFKGLMDCSEKFNSVFQTAVLRYDGAYEEDPLDDVTYESSGRDGLTMNPLNTGTQDNNSISMPELKTIKEESDDVLKQKPDYKFYLSYDFYPLDNPHYHKHGLYGFNQTEQKVYTPQFNHMSMKLPSFPLMVELDEARRLKTCNATTLDDQCKEKYCECCHILEIPYNAVVELVLIDKGVVYDANHPFHLHGYLFRVLGMERLSTSITEEEVRRLDDAGLLYRNFDHPPSKDTVTVPDGGYTIVRWKADNPGYWIFHCHIEFHVELGMSIVFKVGDESQFAQKPKNFPTCGNYLPTVEEAINRETKPTVVKEYYYNNLAVNNQISQISYLLSVILLAKLT